MLGDHEWIIMTKCKKYDIFGRFIANHNNDFLWFLSIFLPKKIFGHIKLLRS